MAWCNDKSHQAYTENEYNISVTVVEFPV